MWFPLLPLLVHASIGNTSDPAGVSNTSATRRPVRVASAAPQARHFGVEADAQIADLGSDRLPRGAQVNTISGTNNSAGGAANAAAAPRGAFAELDLAAATSKAQVAHHHDEDTSKVNHTDHVAAPKSVQGTFAELEQHAGKAHAATKALARMHADCDGVDVPGAKVDDNFLLPAQVVGLIEDEDARKNNLAMRAERLGVERALVQGVIDTWNWWKGLSEPEVQEDGNWSLNGVWNGVGKLAANAGGLVGLTPENAFKDAKLDMLATILRRQVILDPKVFNRAFVVDTPHRLSVATLSEKGLGPMLLHGGAHKNEMISTTGKLRGENWGQMLTQIQDSWFILDGASRDALAFGVNGEEPLIPGLAEHTHAAVIKYWETTNTALAWFQRNAVGGGSDCNGLTDGLTRAVGASAEITYMGLGVDYGWLHDENHSYNTDRQTTAIMVDHIIVLPVSFKGS